MVSIKTNVNWIKQNIIDRQKVKNRQKIFCVGRNKTGTTSLNRAFKDLGFIVGNQRRGELLFENYMKRDYNPIFRFCRTAQVFQDIPFSCPNLFRELDQRFPESKFILTIRDSGEEWYESLLRFHSKVFADGKRVPTANDLKKANYVYKGWIWKVNRAIYNTPTNEPYKKKELIQKYILHNQSVEDYFDGSNKLLILNLKSKLAYQRFCEFIEKKPIYEKFPWLNKTSDIL